VVDSIGEGVSGNKSGQIVLVPNGGLLLSQERRNNNLYRMIIRAAAVAER